MKMKKLTALASIHDDNLGSSGPLQTLEFVHTLPPKAQCINQHVHISVNCEMVQLCIFPVSAVSRCYRVPA